MIQVKAKFLNLTCTRKQNRQPNWSANRRNSRYKDGRTYEGIPFLNLKTN